VYNKDFVKDDLQKGALGVVYKKQESIGDTAQNLWRGGAQESTFSFSFQM